MLTTGLMTLAANELLTLLPWANMPLKMIVSVLFTGLFVEGSLFYLSAGLRREASDDHRLAWWEWGLPTGMVGGTVVLSATTIGVIMLLKEALEALYATILAWF